jgi:hypothetical protein
MSMDIDFRKKLKKEADEGGIVGLDEALAKVALELMKPDGEKLYAVSDLTPEEVFGVSSLLAYADHLQSDTIKGWLRMLLLLRISRFRLGRKEFLVILTGLQQVSAGKGGSKSIKDIFAGF